MEKENRYLAVFHKEWEVVDAKRNYQVIAPAKNRREAVEFAEQLNREEVIALVPY